MNTLEQIEQSILSLSQMELERLREWLQELMQAPLGVSEPRPRKIPELGERMTFDEYLDYSASARIRYEYLAGELIAMSGASRRHNRIARRLCRAFEDHLKGGPCEVYISDVLVRVRVDRDDCGYYPDVMVVCDRDPCEQRFVTNPKLIVEVLSPSSAHIDHSEKRYNYRRIPQLQEYVTVAQDAPEVTIYGRDTAWQPTVHDSLQSVLELRSIGLSLSISALYEGV